MVQVLKINYQFKDLSLLKKALNHSSAVKNKLDNNEKLEFLGDRVLGICMADILYSKYPNELEGDLAKRHSSLVCTDMLYKVSQTINLADLINVSNSISKNGSLDNKNILADAMEALIGAIYLDSDFTTVFKFIEDLWSEEINFMQDPPTDFKTKLQEYLQGKGNPLPSYKVVSREGPDHNPDFIIQVSCIFNGNDASSTGKGKSKREAEQNSAKDLLNKLKK